MLSIIMPVFNEEGSVENTIDELKKEMERLKVAYELIVVDDGSTDKSSQILKNIRKIKLMTHPYNLGYGASLKTGLKVAKYSYILIIDADGTYPIMDISKLLRHSKSYDMVVGARTGRKVSDPILRKPAKLFLRTLARLLTGRNIPDINSGFRIFRKDVAMEFFHLFPSGFSFTTTITIACLTNDYTVKYVPINYFKRKGTSTIHPIKDFVGFTTLMFRLIMYFNPLRIFLFPSLFLFVIGLIILLYDALIRVDITDLPIIVLLAAFQLGFLGLLADLIVKRK
ncbi:MAG TPA: glycosyltransferase family 2 protein [Candidatus Nanoarchaeia archaeon]|nr:glycosyltransferase family 2 protein [Candidatus Nanoarchaeia archaeon]